jgi:hypothetical protein
MSVSEPSKPVREKAADGIYPRCVWCNGEIYGPAVIAYSRGEAGCHQCGKTLPKEYISAKVEP